MNSISVTKYGLLAWLCMLVFLYTGCASVENIALTKDAKASIQSVSIDKDVPIPNDMLYYGRKQHLLGAGLGIFGIGIAAGTVEEPIKMLKDTMKKADIDIGNILMKKFEEELKKSGMFVSINQDGSSASFKLAVRVYGFFLPHGFSGQLKPVLGVEGSLVRADGTVLWKKFENVTSINSQTPSHTLEEYLENAEFIREAFTTASSIIVGELINDMRGEN